MSQTLIALGAVDGNWDLSVPANLFFHLNSSCLIRSGDPKSSLYMATTSSNDGNFSVVHKTDGIRFIILAEVPTVRKIALLSPYFLDAGQPGFIFYFTFYLFGGGCVRTSLPTGLERWSVADMLH